MVPADDQAMVLPWASVMVIIVLLKLAFTCATPEAMFLRSRRRTRVASLPILHPLAAPHHMGRADSRGRSTRNPGRRVGLKITSSCRRSAWPVPFGYGHWYVCAGRARAIHGGDAIHDSSRGPSTA